jgi:hypothetical protein
MAMSFLKGSVDGFRPEGGAREDEVRPGRFSAVAAFPDGEDQEPAADQRGGDQRDGQRQVGDRPQQYAEKQEDGDERDHDLNTSHSRRRTISVNTCSYTCPLNQIPMLSFLGERLFTG